MAGSLAALRPPVTRPTPVRRHRAACAAEGASGPVTDAPRQQQLARRPLLALAGLAALLPLRARAEEAEAAGSGEPAAEQAFSAAAVEEAPPGFARYMGRATSSSSYGGYGGNDDFFKARSAAADSRRLALSAVTLVC